LRRFTRGRHEKGNYHKKRKKKPLSRRKKLRNERIKFGDNRPREKMEKKRMGAILRGSEDLYFVTSSGGGGKKALEKRGEKDRHWL